MTETQSGLIWAVAAMAAQALVIGVPILEHQWWVRVGRPRRRALPDLRRPIAVVRMSEARGLLACVDRLELSPHPDDQTWATNHLWTVRTYAKAERHFGSRRARIRKTALLDEVEARLETRGAVTIGRHRGLVPDVHPDL